MPLDQETLDAIKTTVAESLGTFSETLDTKLEGQHRLSLQKITTLQQEIPGIIENHLKPLQENIKFLEEVKAEYEAELGQNPQKAENPENSTEKVETPDIGAIEARIKEEFEKKLTESKNQLKELEAKLQADQEKAQMTTWQNEAIQAIQKSGLVISGKESRLLGTLEREGKLAKTPEGYKIASTDKFGDPVTLDWSDALSDLIETQYNEYSKPRQGTGTGGQNASGSSSQGFKDFSQMTAQQIYEQGSSVQGDLVKALEQRYNS